MTAFKGWFLMPEEEEAPYSYPRLSRIRVAARVIEIASVAVLFAAVAYFFAAGLFIAVMPGVFIEAQRTGTVELIVRWAITCGVLAIISGLGFTAGHGRAAMIRFCVPGALAAVALVVTALFSYDAAFKRVAAFMNILNIVTAVVLLAMVATGVYAIWAWARSMHAGHQGLAYADEGDGEESEEGETLDGVPAVGYPVAEAAAENPAPAAGFFEDDEVPVPAPASVVPSAAPAPSDLDRTSTIPRVEYGALSTRRMPPAPAHGRAAADAAVTASIAMPAADAAPAAAAPSQPAPAAAAPHADRVFLTPEAVDWFDFDAKAPSGDSSAGRSS